MKTRSVIFLLALIALPLPVRAVTLPGTIKVGKWNGSSYDVYTRTLEDYLRGVAHYEMGYLKHIEAYKCQTVAARGYAACSMGKHGSFDVCNQVHCQRWEPDSNTLTNQSVDATAGQVMIFNKANDTHCGTGSYYYGKIITAWYYGGDTCRGYTRSSQEVWGGCRPWARAVSCYCGRSDTGWYGHGVGMHQQGAYKRAVAGYGYVSILGHYYSDIAVVNAGTPAPGAPNPSITWLDQGVNSGNGQQVKVTCGKPTNATELYYEMSGSGTNNYGWTGNTSYIDGGVYDNQTVSVRCKARGTGGESAYSSWRSVAIGDRTPPANPAAPAVTWNDKGANSGNTQTVTVSRGLTSGANRVEFECTAGSPAYGRAKETATSYTTPAAVADSQTYAYRCRMWDASNNYSSWSAAASVSIGDRTPPAGPLAPTVVWNDAGLNSGDNQSVTVNHSLTTGANRVEFDCTVGSPVYNRAVSTVANYTTPADLDDFQVYGYRCRMWDAAGNYTGWSNAGTVKIGDRTSPAAVGDLVATGEELYGAARLNWSAPSDPGEGAEEYLVRYAVEEIDDLNWQTAQTVEEIAAPSQAGTGEEEVAIGLAVRQTYYFALKTRDRAGNISSLSNLGTAGIRSPASVTRTLPKGYIPGVELQAKVVVKMAPEVASYLVKEDVPLDWEVSKISHGGKWDAEMGEVSWGPLPGGWNSVLSYQLTPPFSETGQRKIVGVGDFDGVAVPVEGLGEMDEGAPLPSDGDGDFVMTISEMVSYATAWKQGEEWDVPPNPVPIDYMVRGAYLWKLGENYHYDRSEFPPLCWQSGPVAVGMEKTGNRGGMAIRTLPQEYQPGISVEVSLQVNPVPGTRYFALEDEYPVGWSIENISQDGNWDAANGKVKWGLFEGDEPRILSYFARSPVEDRGLKSFVGSVNLDGETVVVSGDRQIASLPEIFPTPLEYKIPTPSPLVIATPWTQPSVEVNSTPFLAIPLLSTVAGDDYDGDGTSEVALFRPSTGLWAIRNLTRFYFGCPGDLPVSADYTGDGTTTAAIFRGSSGLWAARRGTRIYFGQAGDIPVPGDYGGAGISEIAVFRPSSGLWVIRGTSRIYFGTAGDYPFWHYSCQEGRGRPGIIRPSSGLWAVQGLTRFYLGRSGDSPLAGDFAGDGGAWTGIYRPESGLWLIRDWTRFYFGGGEDQPVPADYRGENMMLPTVFRPSSGLWSLGSSSKIYYGQEGDIPLAR